MKPVFMGAWRFALALTVVFLLIATCNASFFEFGSDCGEGPSHNFYFGRRGMTDELLFMDHVRQPSKLLRKFSIDVSYPIQGDTSFSPAIITYIEALDQRSDGSGACVYIRNGGVGAHYVTLHVKSLRNHGINHVIRVYGYPSKVEI